MRKYFLIIFVLINSLFTYSQDTKLFDLARNDLKDLKNSFLTKKSDFENENKKLQEIINSLNSNPSEQFNKTIKLKKDMDSIYNKRKIFKDYYLTKNVPDTLLENSFPAIKDYKFLNELNNENVKEALPEKKIYYLFGDNDLISEQDLISNKEVNQVFSKVIDEKSKSNLGKFEIPAVGQLIPIYKKGSENIYAAFEEVNLTIKEGAIEDIRVTLIDKKKGLKFYFENHLSASLLRYTLNSKFFYINNSFVTSINPDKAYKNDELFNDIYICLKDVLRYYPNSGNNYVPDDQNLIFPVPSKIEKQDTSKIGVYELVQDTSLQNTVEFRTYTDFLGLFNNSPNGLVQIQGKADFYLNPFRVARKTFVKHFYFFKKITPYVNFSKLDDANRGLDLLSSVSLTDTIYSIKTPLQIIEKSYLELGVNLNIFSAKFFKEMPFKINLYFPLRYNATSVFKDKSDNTNFKLVTYGLGTCLEFKRFSNFGFNYSIEYTNSESINKYENIINPSQFFILKNEAEIFYYPGESKNQSIFTRFRTFYNSEDNRDSFFQFQFGYRFTIGAGRVKM